MPAVFAAGRLALGTRVATSASVMSRALPGTTPGIPLDTTNTQPGGTLLASTPTLLKQLVGSGDRIGLAVLPYALAGVALNVVRPEFFRVGGPPHTLAVLAALLLGAGLVNWAWSVALILTKIPRGELITSGPYALVKHPLYTGVALLVLPWLGLLLDSWLGIALGGALYAASRRFAPSEEQELSTKFGTRWEEYRQSVKLPWL